MRKYALMVGLLLLCLSPVAKAEAINMEEPGKLPPGRIEMPDKSQEDDCDCCQKCKAAKKPVLPQEEEGPAIKDGCAECCERCGRALPSAPVETPPDIIDKPKP